MCDAWGPLAGEMLQPVQGAQASGAPRGRVGLGSLREAPALRSLLCRSHSLGLGLGLASLRSPPHRVVWMWGEGGVWTRWSLTRKISVKPRVLETPGTVSRPRQRSTGWRRRMGSEGTGSQGAQTPSQRAFPSEAEGPSAPEPLRGCPRLRTHRMEPPEPEEGICFYLFLNVFLRFFHSSAKTCI